MNMCACACMHLNQTLFALILSCFTFMDCEWTWHHVQTKIKAEQGAFWCTMHKIDQGGLFVSIGLLRLAPTMSKTVTHCARTALARA